MTAKLIGNPRFIEELAPSGYVLTYETGTTNAKSVYQDSGQAAAHSGPPSGANAGAIGFTLNINGQETVYWASGLYRIRVYQSDDTLLYEIDNFDPQVQEDATSTINLIPNGSFEIDGDLDSNPDNWTLSDATLETITKETDQHKHGKASLKGISTGSGSGYATTDDFITIGDRKDLEISFEGRVDTITLNMRLRVYWYDESEVALGTPSTDVHSATLGTVDAWIAFRYRVTPPSGARLCKVEAYPVTNAIAGNAWMDNIVLQEVANPVVTTHTATATLTNADAGLHLIDASGGDVALTLPSAVDVKGMTFTFVRTEGSNKASIIAAGADTIDGSATDPDYFDSGDVVTLVSDGVSDWRTVGKVLDHPLPRAYITGLTLSNNGSDASHDIDIAVGECRDGSDSANMVIGGTLTKQIDASWAIGNNAGGLDGTESVSGTPDANTWYHVWLLRDPATGLMDASFSESASAPTLVGNYTQKRRIGAVLTDGSANIIAFYQHKDRFFWKLQVQDFSLASSSTGYVTRTLTVPTGIKVLAIHTLAIDSTQVTPYYTIAVRYVDTTGAASSSNYTVGTSNSSGVGQTTLHIETDTSARYRTRNSHTDSTLKNTGHTMGWIDPRGGDV